MSVTISNSDNARPVPRRAARMPVGPPPGEDTRRGEKSENHPMIRRSQWSFEGLSRSLMFPIVCNRKRVRAYPLMRRNFPPLPYSLCSLSPRRRFVGLIGGLAGWRRTSTSTGMRVALLLPSVPTSLYPSALCNTTASTYIYYSCTYCTYARTGPNKRAPASASHHSPACPPARSYVWRRATFVYS